MCLLSLSRNEAHFIWLFIRWQKSKSAALKYFSLQFNTLTGSSPACPSKGELLMGHVDGCEGDGSAEENGLMRIRPGYQKDLCFVDVWSRWKPLQMVNQHPNLIVLRTQLQLLASACLLLASKLHDPRPMSLLNLVVFTDCSISVPELQSMEMLVLEKLR